MNKILFPVSALLLGAAFTLPLAHSKPGDGKDGKGEKDASAVFDAIDANDDDKITAKELADSKKFKDAEPKEVRAAFSRKDLNEDGAITPREFEKTFGERTGRPRGKGGKGRKGGKGGKGGKSS